jgi:hypothetical protein
VWASLQAVLAVEICGLHSSRVFNIQCSALTFLSGGNPQEDAHRIRHPPVLPDDATHILFCHLEAQAYRRPMPDLGDLDLHGVIDQRSSNEFD